MNIDEVEKYVERYHLLYPVDIKFFFKRILYIFPRMKEELSRINDNEMSNIIKFLDTILFTIDYLVYNGKPLKFIFNDFDYLPTPSIGRVSILISLFGNLNINIEDIINIKYLDEIELVYNTSKMQNKDNINLLRNRIIITPELLVYYYNLLSELCYKILCKLVKYHTFDFNKYAFKLTYKMIKMNRINQKKELLKFFLSSSNINKEMLFSNSIIFEGYDFNNHINGKMWFNIYNILKSFIL